MSLKARISIVVAVVAVAALVAGLSVGVASGGDARPSELRLNACPKNPQPLPPAALAGATRAALRQAHERALYGSLNLKGMEATSATLGSYDGRAHFLWRKCGHRVEERSVVVSLNFPHAPSASLGQGTVVLSLLSGRYRVWGLVH